MQENKSKKFLIFSLGQKESYGISIDRVLEIKELLPSTPAPKMVHYMKGFASFRNSILTIFDLAKRFDLPECKCRVTIVLIVKDGSEAIGVDVERVSDIIELEDEDELIEYSSLGFNANSCIT